MEGSIASRKRRATLRELYYIRSLSAPMRLSITGEVCRSLSITEGSILTIGRSKKSCDVTFDDARVSRKHCQLCLLPHSNTLVLFHGSTTSVNGTDISHLERSLEIEDAGRFFSLREMHNGLPDDGSHSKQLKRLPEDLWNIKNARKLRRKVKSRQHPEGKCSSMEISLSRAVGHKPVMEASGQWMPSLNGIFVNGHEFCARAMVLMPGDEVSLVGPTEGGKCLDNDCPAAIGFLVETRPMVEQANATISGLPLQSTTQHTVGSKLSSPGMDCISHGVDHGSSCKRTTLNDMQEKQPELLSFKSSHCNQPVGTLNVHSCSMIVRCVDGNQCGESDTETGNSSTNHSIIAQSTGPVQKRSAQANEASSLVDLDCKLRSTFNLVNASIRLRSDLLNCYIGGSSQAVEGQNEPPAEKRVHSTQENSTHKIFFMMHTVENATELCGSPLEKQVGDCGNKKDECFSSEHTVKVGSIPSPQVILSEKSKKLEDYSLSALEIGAAVLPIPAPLDKEEGFLNESSVVNDGSANSLQFTRTLLVPSNTHIAKHTDVLTQMLDDVSCERSIVNYVAPSATNGNSLEAFMSGNSAKESTDVLQAIAQEGVKSQNAEEAKRVNANDAGPMMVKATTSRLTAMQVNEELSKGHARSKDNVNAVHYSYNGRAIERPLGEHALQDESCRSDSGNWLDFSKNGEVPVHITKDHSAIQGDVCCQHSPYTDAAASEGTIKDIDSTCGDRNVMAIGYLARAEFKTTPLKKVQGNEECMDMEVMQREETCAVQNLGLHENVCNLHVRGHLQCTCTLSTSRTEIEVLSGEKFQGNGKSSDIADEQRRETYAVQEPGQQNVSCSVNVKKCVLDVPIGGTCCSGLKEVGLSKEAALECSFQCKIERGLECSVLEAASNKDQVFATHQPEYGMSRAVYEKLDCDRLDDGGTLETDKDFHRSDLCFTGNLAVNFQVDGVVDMTVSEVQTGGYFLNQLEVVTAGACNKDSTVHLWDLLALNDDVQALFIATFTYDMEWFLSFAGLSRDIPVTVACHNVKRCWSKASKDRCEKPYLDWPNVTLVYPPFPRCNSFGSKGQGIGCHHPKIFLVRRSRSLRVIVSSANLTYKQWFHVTNNVWWQDFSCRQTPDFRCLFRGENTSKSSASPDFASQLAMFLAALLVDAPSEAHWVTDLAAFDFSNAGGSLVASVPGLHHPLYQNAPQFLMTLDKEAYYPSLQGDSVVSSFLGVVPTMVAGIKYRFCPSADRNGTRIRSLAAVLNDTLAYEGSTMPVLLKRAKFLKADPNAVSVIVTCRANGCSQDLFLQQDLHDAEIDTMETDVFDTDKGFIKLGFLTRDIASWLAVLCDQGFFSFAACIWPSEALAVASGQSDGAVKLALYVFQGPKFSTLSPNAMTREERGAFSGLLKSLYNTWGLWRLEKVLCRYNWVDSFESDFYVASSSIGTSLDAKFLAAFAAAAGRRADSFTLSQDSDPQWGCWTAEQEAADPSISIVFPTIDRVRQDNFLHYGLLCFAESAWLRLKSARLLHDAVPYPPEREGFPMHIKVARRRFQDPLLSQSYGWVYCGSHNFSPAAWGRPIWRTTDWEAATDAGSILGSSLHICNYELGVVLIEPPPNEDSSGGKKEADIRGLDRFVLPFKVPPPVYRVDDRPATGKAMMEAYMEMRALQLKAAEEDVAVMQSEDRLEEACLAEREDEAACNANREEARAEKDYVEALWSQIDEEDQKIKEIV